MKERNTFYGHLLATGGILLLCWIIQWLEVMWGISWSHWGILPHDSKGLWGILFAPLLHGDWNHLISNSLPFLVLTMVLLHAYPIWGWRIFFLLWVTTGFLVWSLAESRGYHIGMSGVIYGLVAFLLTSGLLRKDRTSGGIAILVGLMYGGMVFGFIPMNGVSWESHLYGSLSGIGYALMFRKADWNGSEVREQAEPEDDRHFFEKYPDSEDRQE